ncbi:MAG: DUF951 domain-containing protein [Clostridia bacterium]
MIDVQIGDKVITKKPHPCKNDCFEVLRTGADYKLKCLKCGKIVMLSYQEFNKAVKNVKTT